MAGLNQLRSQLLNDGKITEKEVEIIRAHVWEDGCLDLSDVKFLVELLSDADEVCLEFDDFFFPMLKRVVLADGRVGYDEQFYLLKMLYSDGHVRESERQFLRELLRDATDVTPEFQELCETALAADSRCWDVGGTCRS